MKQPFIQEVESSSHRNEDGPERSILNLALMHTVLENLYMLSGTKEYLY